MQKKGNEVTFCVDLSMTSTDIILHILKESPLTIAAVNTTLSIVRVLLDRVGWNCVIIMLYQNLASNMRSLLYMLAEHEVIHSGVSRAMIGKDHFFSLWL